VIKRGAADAAEDTRFVELKARLIGFNGDTDWLNINGGAQSVFGVGHILVATNFGVRGGSARRSLASTIFGSVRIGGFSAKTVGLHVFEGVIHKTTRASKVTITV